MDLESRVNCVQVGLLKHPYGGNIGMGKIQPNIINQNYADLGSGTRWLLRGIAWVLKLVYSSAVPMAIITILSTVRAEQWNLSEYLWLSWAVCEMGCFIRWKQMLLGPSVRKPCTVALNDQVSNVKHALSHIDNIDEVLSYWMLKRPKTALSIGHFKDWIVNLFLDKDPKLMTPEEKSVAQQIFPLFGARLPKTSSPAQPLKKKLFMNPSTDDLPCHYKPMVVTLYLAALRLIAASVLRMLGFKRFVTKQQSYWLLQGSSTEPAIMYVHGIGIGFFMYLPKIWEIVSRHPGRSVILLDQPHISMAPAETILDRNHTLAALDDILIRHAVAKISIIAHSYGTIVASWITQLRPHYLTQLVLVDPVCFRMWDATLAKNFLYAEPISLLHEIMRFFVSQDPMISRTVGRELYWYESMLYPERITVPSTIFLSTQDWLVSPTSTKAYLEKRLPCHANLVLFDTFHGGSLLNKGYYTQISQCIN
ncbi:hypothetical protein DSO57_1003062 [Entomophthora muscae]|uniref:Uncharacterized protein n=1 Tax=Entomophthora muscae TaxID=34485 RepID=A0ACC2TJA3_9FUNG|nr:hypothetical protein DSO57_1003062 [Entomophthora muscae]